MGNNWLNESKDRYVAYLNGDASFRKLLARWMNDWNGDWWFLAFRKQST